MKTQYKMIALCAMCSVLAVGCGPKKDEGKPLPPPAKVEQKEDTLLSYPDNQDLEQQKKGQKPSEQELESQKNQDSVFNPPPG